MQRVHQLLVQELRFRRLLAGEHPDPKPERFPQYLPKNDCTLGPAIYSTDTEVGSLVNA